MYYLQHYFYIYLTIFILFYDGEDFLQMHLLHIFSHCSNTIFFLHYSNENVTDMSFFFFFTIQKCFLW